MGTKWNDLECDGRRLARLIRFLETKMKKTKDDDDSTVRYAQTIGNLISKKVEVVKICDRYEEINKKYEEDMKEQRQQEATVRKYRREAEKTTKQELVNEINRAEYAAANDELVSKQHTQEMRI